MIKIRPKYKELYNKQLKENEDLKKVIGVYQRALDYMMKNNYIENYIDNESYSITGNTLLYLSIKVDKNYDESICIKK